MPQFTVITPTYQRARTLPRAAGSLARQTLHDFEWLVIDDGSTDGTDRLIERLAAELPFPVRYHWQPNGGKHRALNHAAALATGDLVVVLDSDDECVPEALERLAVHWSAIPEADRRAYSGVTCLVQDQHGRLVGDPYPCDVMDSDGLTIRYRHRARGERWGCLRRDVLRAFPFPEPDGIRYIPESLVWDAIAETYRTRFVNEILRVYHRGEPDQLTAASARRGQASGLLLLYAHNLGLSRRWLRHNPARFCKDAASFVRYALHLHLSPRECWSRLEPGPGRLLAVAAAPVGTLLWLCDLARARTLRHGQAAVTEPA